MGDKPHRREERADHRLRPLNDRHDKGGRGARQLGIGTMGIETLAAKIQGYELRSGGYRVFSSFPKRTVKEELFRDLQIHRKGKKVTWM
ncbi:hypothetical protein H5410_036419 [Solanum commersonii]|uniref:Uncharacterized protein n=1 Tax=Solanum commersonii TaxID=4109 RepID=A0A9J5Y3H6_SOLCO|nr:hypothetical protein H5410_036419 [Solanum commersonii]